MWDKQDNTFNIELDGYLNCSALINSGAGPSGHFPEDKNWSTIFYDIKLIKPDE